MGIREIQKAKLLRLYQGDSLQCLLTIGQILEPELNDIVNTFYTELSELPEMSLILENTLVQKNLKASLRNWIQALFQPHDRGQVEEMLDRQKQIGLVHANVNVSLSFFAHGVSIIKRELCGRLQKQTSARLELGEAFLAIGQLVDLLFSVIAEAYFSNEIAHETNELSLRMKGLTQTSAIECERLRSLLLDWLRNALTFLYRTQEIHMDSLPKLEHSDFGLWVVYKADLLPQQLNASSGLRKHINAIDEALVAAAQLRIRADEREFFDSIGELNEAVTKASWFISSIVDQVVEMDWGLDPLTRLFNRRYLETILRRQTQISMKQGLPYSIVLIDLDHFKEINDLYGHESGDAVLKQFSELLLSSVRASDFIFRYGGEEFLMVLGNVAKQQALIIAEKIRERCEQHVFSISANRHIRRTCSIGISSFSGHPDYNRLVREADTALYQAKQAGRNRVATAG